MELSAPALAPGAPIPGRFTGDGADISPALAWKGAPADTSCFAVILEDPDAPTGLWTHWTLYDLPAAARSLAENLPKAPTLPDGTRQGRNTWGRIGYNGPAPPPGKPHRYVFRVLALSGFLDLAAGAERKEVDAALEGKILAEASLTATYGRSGSGR